MGGTIADRIRARLTESAIGARTALANAGLRPDTTRIVRRNKPASRRDQTLCTLQRAPASLAAEESDPGLRPPIVADVSDSIGRGAGCFESTSATWWPAGRPGRSFRIGRLFADELRNREPFEDVTFGSVLPA